MFTLESLKDEIVNDPNSIGYKNSATPTDWKGDQLIADLINSLANGAVIRRTNVLPAEVKAVIIIGDFNSLSPKQTGYIQWVVQGDRGLDLSPDSIFEGLNSLFSGTPTELPLLDVLQRQGSRAEVLWGEGSSINAGLVGRAFNLVP